MKVSVVIPMYNSASFIEKTLRCVLAQDFQDFEVVVVNDGSTDGSSDVVRTIGDPRIRVIDKSNTGVSDTRNVGNAAARGEYIASLDSDDYWYPDHLSEAMAFFEANPDMVWYGARQYSIAFDENPPEQKRPRRCFRKRNFFVDGKRFIHSSSMVFRKDIVERCGEYPIDMAYFEDWMFQGQFGAEYPIVGTNDRVTSIYHRGRPGSATMIDTEDRTNDYRRVLHLLEDAVERNKVKSPTWVLSISKLFFRTMLFRHSREDVLSAIQEFSSLNGRMRTGRWRRFVKIAYMLSDDRMHDWLVVMVKKGFKDRLRDTVPIMRKYGVWCSVKWLAIVSLYAVRGILDAIQDRLEHVVIPGMCRGL